MPSRKFACLLLVAAFSLMACNVGSLLGDATATRSPLPTSPSLPVPTPADEERGPQEAIFIASPGSSSMLTAPITVTGEADPTFEQNLVVAIYGEEGARLAMGATTIEADLGQRGPFSLELNFSVTAQQAGRIVVFDQSAIDGGIAHLASVEVILMPSGASQINTDTPSPESIALILPPQGAEVGGGRIPVTGFSDYYFESTLGYMLCGGGVETGPSNELCGTEDNVLSTGAIMIQSPDIGQPGPIDAEIMYSVAEPTTARLVVYASSPRDGGLLHVTSRVLQLNP